MIEHEGVRKSFDAWVDRHENGRYVLRNSVNWAFVEIEGAPMIVRSVQITDADWSLSLSDGRTESMRVETLRQDADGILYCQVRSGRLTAQYSRRAMFDVESAVDEDEIGIVLKIGDRTVRPPVSESPIE